MLVLCLLTSLVARADSILIEKYRAFSGWYLGSAAVRSIRIRGVQGQYELLLTADSQRSAIQYYVNGAPHSRIVWNGREAFLSRPDSAEQLLTDPCVIAQFRAETMWLTGAFASSMYEPMWHDVAPRESLMKMRDVGEFRISFDENHAPASALFTCRGKVTVYRALRYARIAPQNFAVMQGYVRNSEPPVEVRHVEFNERVYDAEFEKKR